MSSSMNKYQSAIERNAEWFQARQKANGYVDAEGDEFYGLRGDATLVGHSVSVRVFAFGLTGNEMYLEAATKSLEWLATHQDPDGGWKHQSAFTHDGAQCAFEGFNTYRRCTGIRRFDGNLVRAADRMLRGVLRDDGGLRLRNVIEIGEYAHFAMFAFKTTGEERFRKAAESLVTHITRNFDEKEGYWVPYDKDAVPSPGGELLRSVLSPLLHKILPALPVRGRLAARMADHLLPLLAATPRPQYSMSLMDAEALLDTVDGSSSFPELERQTRRAVRWATLQCRGPFRNTVTESRPTNPHDQVYPLPILNDTRLAALWPTTCLLLAYCGLNDSNLREEALLVADSILEFQGEDGGFHNFREPDGTLQPLQSGNVNFYASMSLWVYGEVYGNGPMLIVRPS